MSGSTAEAPDARSVETGFRRQSQRFRLLLLYGLFVAPWVLMGVVGALQPTVNSPLDWVDSSFEPRNAYDHFCSRFGAGDTVVISWPGCTVDEVAIDAFVSSLRQSPGFYQDGEWLFRRVLSGREAYLSLISPPIGLAPQEARRRRAGTLIGPDGQTTCVVVFFNSKGLQQRSRLVPLIRAASSRFGKAEFTSQHLAGPIMDGYAVDRSSQSSMQRFAPLSSIIAFCACIICLDGLYAAILVFGLSCVGQAVALAVIYHCGGSLTALLIVIPPLVQVLAISSGVHFVNYYRTAAKQHGEMGGIAEALRLGAVPCALSAATTAIGLASLSVSGLSAVREFGVYAAIGVLANVVLLLAFLPGLLALPFQWASRDPLPKRGSERDHSSASRQRFVWLNWLRWDRLTRFQQRFGLLVAFVALVIMIGLVQGRCGCRLRFESKRCLPKRIH